MRGRNKELREVQMKFKFLLMVVFCLNATAATDVIVPRGITRSLVCEMKDLATGRVVDQNTAEISPGSQAPVLLLLGYGALMGTVRDTAGASENERKIELRLSYQAGASYGTAEANRSYQLDQIREDISVADVNLEEPNYQKPISLQCFIHSRAEFQTLSTTSYENGRGNASAFCDGNMGSFCIDQVKSRARDAAVRDAQWTCEMRRGRADTLFPSCYDTCSPFSIPPGAPSQMVSCSANCSVRCEIP